jgi:L-iditol 2-dehydrogenase
MRKIRNIPRTLRIIRRGTERDNVFTIAIFFYICQEIKNNKGGIQMAENTMKAIVCHGFGKQHRFEQAVPIPKVGPGEALVKVDAAGICAADRAMYFGTGPWQLTFPFIPGHEFTGQVVELGEGAATRHGVQAGDRTVAELNVTHGNDFFTQRGLYHLTDTMDVIGATLNGGWAEYMKYPANAVVHKIPENLSAKAAVYVEPLANALRGVERANIQFGDVVVVAGAGPIGMGMLQAARLKTPKALILLDISAPKRELALTLGADYAFSPTKPDYQEALDDLTQGRGFDVFLEASGSTESFELALETARKAATIVVFGVYKKKASVDLNLISEFKELNILGGHLAPFTYPKAIDLMARGLINGDAMITDVFALEEITKALELPDSDIKPRIKVIFDPTL